MTPRKPGAPVSVVLAGGGTAGHTSPLIATAHEITRLAPEAVVTAVGTARGLETSVVPAAGLTLELIPPVPMPRKPGRDLLLVPARLRSAVTEAGRLLDRLHADVVLGFGGYVSTPVYLAARRRRVPIVIHEQNALPGLANRLAARFSDHVFTSFPDTPLPGATCIGLPLRGAITGLDRVAGRAAARTAFGLPGDGQALLVSGGSQGAASLNRAVLGARAALLSAGVSAQSAEVTRTTRGPRAWSAATKPCRSLSRSRIAGSSLLISRPSPMRRSPGARLMIPATGTKARRRVRPPERRSCLPAPCLPRLQCGACRRRCRTASPPRPPR